MNKEELIESINRYIPYNEQEEKDKAFILDMIFKCDDIFLRDNLFAHMSASSWIVNKDRTKTIMVYHNIFNSWSWLGGHADGNVDLFEVALKEAKEESGVKNIKPLSKDIYSLEVLTVNGHEKNGKYVSSHLHLNITYLLEADENDELIIKEDENSGVKWFNLDEVIEASSEEWYKERIYPKLIDKLSLYK